MAVSTAVDQRDDPKPESLNAKVSGFSASQGCGLLLVSSAPVNAHTISPTFAASTILQVETLIAGGGINEDGPANAHASVTNTNLHIIGDQMHREGKHVVILRWFVVLDVV